MFLFHFFIEAKKKNCNYRVIYAAPHIAIKKNTMEKTFTNIHRKIKTRKSFIYSKFMLCSSTPYVI